LIASLVVGQSLLLVSTPASGEPAAGRKPQPHITSAGSVLPFAVSPPALAEITSPSGNQAPWNEFQGDVGTGTTPYQTSLLLPTYTPGGIVRPRRTGRPCPGRPALRIQ
jgi:hypothetical protein